MANVVEVQQLLGHSSLDTTKRYLEATANELCDAVRAHPSHLAPWRWLLTLVVPTARVDFERGTISVGLDQLMPEQADGLGVIGPVLVIFGEGDGGVGLVQVALDFHVDPEVGEHIHPLGVEVSHGLRLEDDVTTVAVAGADEQLVTAEVELEVENPVAVQECVASGPAG